MANWLSADELSRLFVVQPGTLASYSARGNLGSRLDVRGQRVFSRRQVESLFPRRGKNGCRMGTGLGRLGQMKLEPNKCLRLAKRQEHQAARQSSERTLSRSA